MDDTAEDMISNEDESSPQQTMGDESEQEEQEEQESSKDEEQVIEFVYESEDQEIPKAIQNTMKKLIVRGPVKTIGKRAFEKCETLEEIDFTEATALETIGKEAFSKCRNLLAFQCPSNVKIIGQMAFDECTNLREIDFSEATALELVGNAAFKECRSLLAFNCPSNLKIIVRFAFMGCENLKEVDFTQAAALETIGEQAFCDCSSLLAFKCPSNVNFIGDMAFQECENLREIDFSEATALEAIGGQAFLKCPCLLAFKCPPSVKTVGRQAFENSFGECERLKEVDFSKATALEMIGEEAFIYCTSLGGTFKCPPSVKTIGYQAFSQCVNLKEADFSNARALDTIEAMAFYQCWDLHSFKCPSNVKTIENQAFERCYRLKEVDLRESTVLETIGEEAFYNCGCLEKFSIPFNVSVVGKNVLKRCNNLISLDVPSANPAIHIRFYTQLGEEQKHLINWDNVVNLYASNPIQRSELVENLGKDITVLEKVRASYIGSIIDGTRRLHSIPERNGWLKFLANNAADEEDPYMIKLCDYLKEKANLKRVRQLADIKDQSARVAKSVAPRHIQKVFEERLFFLGRYDIEKGPPIHQSATCVVVKATDAKMMEYFEEKYKSYEGKEVGKDAFKAILGKVELIPHDDKNINHLFQRADVDKNGIISKKEFVEFCLDEIGCNVVLKFMRNKDQFHREVDRRKNNGLDSKYIVGSIGSHDQEKSDTGLVQSLRNSFLQEDGADTSFLEQDEVSTEYRSVLVMPYGDRNLDTIFRSERPAPIAVRNLMTEIGEALLHLHEKDIVHGDIKMLNAVRTNRRLLLIDLDASTKVGDYIGSKFSSGVLPPEMIHELKTRKELDLYENYVEQGRNSEDEKDKRKVLTTTGQDVRHFVVRSFWEETQEVKSWDEFNERYNAVQTLVPIKKADLPYELLAAHTSLDVWSFGVLLFELITKESLFKVNNEDDITDGDAMRQLHDWNDEDTKSKLKLKVTDAYGRDLLQKILRRDMKDRLTMQQVLAHDYFKPDAVKSESEALSRIEKRAMENQEIIKVNFAQIHKSFGQIHDSLKRVMRYQAAANDLLKLIFKGEKPQPKYFVILPVAEEVNKEKGFSRFITAMKKASMPSSILTTKAMLYFICPLTLQPVVGTDGEAIGYDIDMPQGWIKKYGPAILIGLKVVQVGLAVGRGFGLPLPSLSGAEEGLKETSNLFSEMQGLLVDEMGGDNEEDGLADVLLERFTDRIDSAASAEGPALTKKHLNRIQKSYDGIGLLIKDESFERCGLTMAVSKDETEYVHPEVEQLFEKFGSKCLEMSIEQREKENATLSAVARNTNRDTEHGFSANGDVENKAESAVSVESSACIPEHEMAQQQENLGTKQLQSISADSAVIARLEDVKSKLTTLEDVSLKLSKFEGLNAKIDHMNYAIQNKLQGIPQGSTNVIHKGWLRIQSRRSPFLWNARYVVVYKNGSITHYPNAGSTFLEVKWIDRKDGTIELRSEDKMIAKAKLSARCSSTTTDWLKGNTWNSDYERFATNSSRKAAVASRTDLTGNVIKIETADC
ncbi:unnamed protein product [Cylindrotheca closterium]|uniref:Uncharacterized protein n=1 Tax=Cylindrotheca closterium TaxID=2856 RepID=A0AAD2CK79_9STRA|nr:unnamed protein product [Cylindrotheca closterium]